MGKKIEMHKHLSHPHPPKIHITVFVFNII